jgi:hypothetical protein
MCQLWLSTTEHRRCGPRKASNAERLYWHAPHRSSRMLDRVAVSIIRTTVWRLNGLHPSNLSGIESKRRSVQSCAAKHFIFDKALIRCDQ